MACGGDRADRFANLIREHEKAIIEKMDIDAILNQLPYKKCISESDFRFLTAETNSSKKSKLFVNILLDKKEMRVLEAFLQLVIKSNPGDVLLVGVRRQFEQFKRKKEESNPDDELEDEIKAARTVINDQIKRIESLEGVNSRLQGEVSDLKTERDELQSENAGLRKDMDTLQRLKNDNSELKAQLETAKEKIDELENALHSNKKELTEKLNAMREQMELLKALVSVRGTQTRSKICSLM